MGPLYNMVLPPSPCQLTQLSNEAAHGCNEASFSNKSAISFLLQEPLLLYAKIATAELHRLGINKKQRAPFWCIYPHSANVCTGCSLYTL